MCKMRCFQKNSVSLHSLRDVAQLVAHYVRDVGVASSSPVIPTKKRQEEPSLLVVFSVSFCQILSVGL